MHKLTKGYNILASSSCNYF